MLRDTARGALCEIQVDRDVHPIRLVCDRESPAQSPLMDFSETPVGVASGRLTACPRSFYRQLLLDDPGTDLNCHVIVTTCTSVLYRVRC